jgi:hypothetical protein
LSTRDTIVETRPDISVDELKREASRALVAMQDAERAEQRAVEHFEKTKDEAARRRLELGRILSKARKQWPARGPKAKGWGEFLADIGVGEQSAREWMAMAGYIERQEVSKPSSTGLEIPTRREVQQSKRPEPEPPTEEDRQAAYRREVEASLPPKIEVRASRTHEVIEAASDARAALLRLSERNVHLTDVSTSPDDFMRAKQLLIDIVNQCLEELSNAGVLDGKAQRRQLMLLEGGKQ